MVGDIKSERWARSFRNGGRHRAESADQVLDDQECAHANESRQANGEQNPKTMDLLNTEVDAAHFSSAG
jgi:hypothetical protein